MSLTITKASELANAAPITVVYAPPGAGKTTLLGSLVRKGKEEETLIVDVDEGARVITNTKPDAHILRIDHFEDLDELFHKLKCGDPEWESYKTIAIDTLTKGEQILLWDIMKKKQKSVPTIDHYGERSARVVEFIHDWRSLGRNIVFVCHEQEIDIKEETPYGEEVIITRKLPMLSGKSSQILCAEVDLVLRLGFKQVTDKVSQETKSVRVLQTFKTDTVHAKDRSGNLAKFEPADLRIVLKKWYQAPSEKTVTRNEAEE